MPAVLSVGWFGCRRTAIVPGSPIVLRKRVTTRHFEAAITRSWLRISLLAAAAISGVIPGRTRTSSSPSAASDSNQLRNSPTVRCASGAKARASCVSTISRVTSSSS